MVDGCKIRLNKFNNIMRHIFILLILSAYNKFMKQIIFFLFALVVIGCGGANKKSSEYDPQKNNKPVNLSGMLKTYDEYQNGNQERKDSILWSFVDSRDYDIFCLQILLLFCVCRSMKVRMCRFWLLLRIFTILVLLHGVYGVIMRCGSEDILLTSYGVIRIY